MKFASAFLCICLVQGAVSQEITTRVKIGSTTTLPCRVPESDVSSGQIKWFKIKNGAPDEWLSSNSIILVYKSHLTIAQPVNNEWNLVIKNINRAFDGVYTCTVNGNTRSPIRVIVETKPYINKDLSSDLMMNVPEGTTKVIDCAVDGEPTPDIKWYREIPDTHESVFTNVTARNITLPNVSRYSDGVYTCVVNNTHGHDTINFTVLVNFPPEVAVLNTTIVASTQSRVVMMCAIQGEPLFNTYWKDNHDQPITQNNKFTVQVEDEPTYHTRFLTLVFHKAMWTTDDYGTYTCCADGDTSSTFANATVQLRAPED